MANSYYDSELNADEIETVLEAISGLLIQNNSGKVVGIEDGTLAAKSVSDYFSLQSKSVSQNGTVTPDIGYAGLSQVVVNVSGGGTSFVTPDYQGLAYSYVATSGKYFCNNGGKTYYSAYFPVQSGKTYVLFVGTSVSNRWRVHFYSGKEFSDFEPYVKNPATNLDVYVCTNNISGTSELTDVGLMKRLIFTAPSDGEIVAMTSNNSTAALSYCVEM